MATTTSRPFSSSRRQAASRPSSACPRRQRRWKDGSLRRATTNMPSREATAAGAARWSAAPRPQPSMCGNANGACSGSGKPHRREQAGGPGEKSDRKRSDDHTEVDARSTRRGKWFDARRLGERSFKPLAPHDLPGDIAGNAVGHVGDIGRAVKCAPPLLAVAHEEIGATRFVDGGIGEEVDPQPRRAARHEREVETVVVRRKLGENRVKIGLEQFEPRDLAVAEIGGAIEVLGLFEARLADGFAQGAAGGRTRYRFGVLLHGSQLCPRWLSIPPQAPETR